MQPRLTLSRAKLTDFVACQRRFQLRYEQSLTWPVSPLKTDLAEALARGRQFHQLLQRHFLGLPQDDSLLDEPELTFWWRLYRSQGPQLPVGRRLPELSLSAPIGRHFLTGRFDLLIVTDGGLHIYDWKTEARPPTEAALRHDLQTRLYLALAAEGAAAVVDPVPPEAIQLTYWYATNPPVTISMAYDPLWHGQNWAYLSDLVDEIEQALAQVGPWPLATDLAECRRCAFQVYCGRLQTETDLSDWQSDDEALPGLEPDTP